MFQEDANYTGYSSIYDNGLDVVNFAASDGYLDILKSLINLNIRYDFLPCLLPCSCSVAVWMLPILTLSQQKDAHLIFLLPIML